MNRLLFTLLLFLLCSQNSLAEVFIVTNTSPTGAGSLRDAIEKAAANGTRETDYIHFNISRAGNLNIRIALSDLLPALTSNIVIDGTTQPGTAMGVSAAKIGVSLEGFTSTTNDLYLFDARSATDIKIYGLFLKGNVIDRNTLSMPLRMFGIYLGGSHNIEIGAPSKGNVISGWSTAIYDEANDRYGPPSSSIKIAANFFGLDVDGKGMKYTDRNGGTATNRNSIIFEKNCSDNVIGGSDQASGNIFNSSVCDISIQGKFGGDRRFLISNNKFEVDVDGANLPSSTGTGIQFRDIDIVPLDGIFRTPTITKNFFGGLTRGAAIRGSNTTAACEISDNILGYEERGFAPAGTNYGTGILMENAQRGLISNNIIRYFSSGAIVMDSTVIVQITENSTYCNKYRAIEIRNWKSLNVTRPKPFVTINTLRHSFRDVVGGYSLPNANIEIFHNENCPTCEGKSLIDKIQADAMGFWQYYGFFEGDNVSATATDEYGQTSEYSRPEIDTTQLSISAVKCNDSSGSICGMKLVSGTKWYWEDARGNIVGLDTCLKNVPAGRYFFKVAIGTACDETFAFTIPDHSPLIDSTSVQVKPARCGDNNGSICGINIRNATGYEWINESGIVVNRNLCFENAAPGRYRLRVNGEWGCEIFSQFYTVGNISPKIDASNIVVVHPSCGKNNGSIAGMQVSGVDFSTVRWYNSSGTMVGTGNRITNVGPGQYKLVAFDAVGGCGDSTGFISLNLVASPTLNLADLTVTDATCGLPNGSIRGITTSNTSGTVVYVWVNALNNIVGTGVDLVNVSAGNYRLKVKDGGTCDTLFSPVYSIAGNGSISLDSAALKITNAGCTKNNGSITGLGVTGATSYEWINAATGAVVANNGDAFNLPPGNYYIAAVNSTYGCTLNSRLYSVGTAAALNVNISQTSIKDATCGLNNGSIQMAVSNSSLFSFHWLLDSVTNVGTSLSITNLSPGTYYAIATDTNGCKQNFYKQKISAARLSGLLENDAVVKADTCEMKTGGIYGITAYTDYPEMQFQWYTGSTKVGGNQLNINQLSPGIYYMIFTDGNGCTIRSKDYVVNAVNVPLPPPKYSAVHFQVPRFTDVSLNNTSPRTGIYQLADSAGRVLQQNSTGNFIVQADQESRLEIRYAAGPCVSSSTIITIKVFDDTRLTVPNAFSPNNDGVNDVFKLNVSGYFRLNHLKIFNRYGQIVYESAIPIMDGMAKKMDARCRLEPTTGFLKGST